MSLLNQPIAPLTERPLRAWQSVAVPKVLDAIARKVAGIVIAVTGSGKSVALAEVIAQLLLDGLTDPVVVTTPNRRLVEQLADTIGQRVGHGRVGRFYSSAKQADHPVVICCGNSALALAAHFRRRERRVGVWVADEAHRTEAEGLTMAVHALQPAARVGFTATPFRSSDKESLQLFAEVIHRYSFREALADGVIVPWKVIPWTGEEMPLDEAVLRMIQEHTTGPGVVNATSVADAEGFAEWLTGEGVPAAAVHSRLDEAVQEGRLEALRLGELRCVVYPSLLSEGADFPWLRWSCLRRKVGARVRFVQEVGRVLRTHPGKDEAIILDPRGLFEELSLTNADELGELEKEEEPTPAPEPEAKDDADEFVSPKGTAMAAPADEIVSWARQLYQAAELDGLVDEQGFVDRKKIPTKPQLEAFGRMSWAGKWLPAEHREVVQRLALTRAIPTRGAAKDACDVLFALARRRESWDPSLSVVTPSAEALERLVEDLKTGRWYCAGATKRGVRAIAVIQGSRIVTTGVRDDEADSNWLAVQIAAAKTAARAAGKGATIYLHDEAAFKVLTGAIVPLNAQVKAALAVETPNVTWAQCLPGENPAAGVAWRELSRRKAA